MVVPTHTSFGNAGSQAIAVTGAQRYPLTPGVPTVAESGLKELQG